MSRFMSTRSELYEKAVRVLAELAEREGLDDAGRAWAEVASALVKRRFCEHWRVRPAPNVTNCVGRLVGRRHRPPFYVCDHCNPPGTDHPWLFLRNGKPTLFVSQPYTLSWDEMQRLVDWCRERGLRADVSADESWHFPGRTLAVRIARPEALREGRVLAAPEARSGGGDAA